MSVNVGEINIESTAEAPAAQDGTPRPARPDPAELRLILRREEDRLERLWVD